MIGRWWRWLFPGPPKPSAYLFRHLAAAGDGYELDALIARHEGVPAYQDVIEAVLELMLRHGDQGLEKASARSELRQLAMRLASQGR